MEISGAKPKPAKMLEFVRGKAVIKASILLFVAGIAIGIVESTPLKVCLQPEQFKKILSGAGLMGPALLMIASAVGPCFFIPGTVFVGIGTVIFGPGLSFACVLPGSLAAATISFAIARHLGRDFVVSLIGGRLKKYDESIGCNGFKAVLLLRLMFVPFAPMNFAMGLTRVRFWDYFLATALGEAVTVLVVTLSIGALRDIWTAGDWRLLFSAKMVLSLGFLSALFFSVNLVRSRFGRRPTRAVRASNASERD
jgi:uncharacterized membrane protein YdjX (TVP38/TMEM64 family)